MTQPRTLAMAWSLGALLLHAAPAQQTSYATAQQPVADPVLAVLAGGSMLALPGIGTDFILAGGGQLTQLPGGGARLTARIERDSAVNQVFLLDLVLTGRIDPGTPPPTGSPVLLLQPGAYAPAGPVDPSTWRYYTAASGSLVGLRAFAGARLGLQLTGPAVQVGSGANHRNGTPGLAGEFTVQIQQQPAFPLTSTGNATLHADLRQDRSFATTHVVADSAVSTLAPARALALPGIADDYVFVPVAGWAERGNGTAQLDGTLLRIGQLTDRWQLSLTLSQRVDPGTAGHPPASRPPLGLLPGAYAPGGPIDPTAWHYYQQATGTLTGLDGNVGGVIALTASGAMQVGAGANQGTTHWGAHGLLQVQVTSQPVGRTLTPTGPASLHANLAVAAVLPAPVLNVGPNPTLPTVTELGVQLTGDNLLWIEQVAIGFEILGSQDPASWYGGYYRIVDNTTLDVHPRQGMVPGPYPMSVLNRATRSNQLTLDLVAPTAPRLRTESTVRNFGTQHWVVHHGGMTGPVLTAIGFSPDLLPTVLPGVVQVGIGNQFQTLSVFPGSLPHDPASGVARLTVTPIRGLVGLRMHFQAVLLDLSGVVLPLPASDIWSTDYLP